MKQSISFGIGLNQLGFNDNFEVFSSREGWDIHVYFTEIFCSIFISKKSLHTLKKRTSLGIDDESSF